MSNSNEFLGTGRRKTSVARVRISAGSGKIHVNGRTFEVYFPLESQRMAVQQPFVTTATSGKYDVFINVAGGATTPIGHPLGATGVRLSVTLLHLLARFDEQFGYAGACVGEGQGGGARRGRHLPPCRRAVRMG